ncbi:MAG: 4-hydroxybenzoate octaprenyltransferase [Gammaproteobacteria bacterium]|nr:4-hydroxybenzoate octaprenyltransferase [Gammaproteobacteria bacterium]
MNPLPEKFLAYLQLMRLHKPIGIFLLLWPTLWALWFAAEGPPSWHVLAVFVLGTVLMRSAGCAINDFADRAFDPQVARTKDRPIATGRVTPEEAVRLFVAVSLIAFGLLTSLRNTLALALAVPAALLAASYPFAKRWHSLPQAHLGIAFSWGIPMAYAAVQHAVPWREAGLLMAANICWVIAYDTFYAMADRADDLKIGVRSSAILFGRHDRTITGLLQAATLALLAGVGWARGPYYFAGLAAAGMLAIYQQRLVSKREPARCLRAFLNNNSFGGAIFAGLALDFAFQP